jgi:cysteine desulfurase
VKLPPLMSGGGQERGRRAGTESTLLIVGLGAAAELADRELEAAREHMGAMRDRLASGLLARLPAGRAQVNGPAAHELKLPNTLSISVRGLAAASLLKQLEGRVAASAGAACHGASSGGGGTVSSVLMAMGLQPELAVGTLRLSTGRHTTSQEVDAVIDLITAAVERQGRWPPC